MDFEPTYTGEQEKFRLEVRAWLAENLPSGIVHPADPIDLTTEQYELRRDLGRRLGEKGWLWPTAPEKYRRETVWVYSQGAPPVFKGDLYYYSVDHDLRETAQQIDTSKVGVYLLTGEYDWASTPEQSEELAERIKGAKYQTMQGLGHFPMSEDPERCIEFIEPILNEIRETRP